MPIELNSRVITIPLCDNNGPSSALFFVLAQTSNLGDVGLYRNTTFLYYLARAAADTQGSFNGGYKIMYRASGRIKILDFYGDTLYIVSLELEIYFIEETHSRN